MSSIGDAASEDGGLEVLQYSFLKILKKQNILVVCYGGERYLCTASL